MRVKIVSLVVAGAIGGWLCLLDAGQVSTITDTLIQFGYTPVKLKRTQNDLYVPCNLNGQSLNMKLDTGAGSTLVNASRLSSLGVQLKKVEGDFYGAMGSAAKSVQAGEIKDFQVGAYKAGAQMVGGWDFSYRPPRQGSAPMDGLLGIDFLHRHQAIIDCFQMNLFLKSTTAPSSSSALSAGLRAGGCTEIPLHVSRDGLAVSVTIDGRSGYLLLDTGAPNTILREHAVAGLDMRRGAISARTRVGMIDVGRNVAQVQIVHFHSMQIGSFNVPPQGVAVADLPTLRGGGPGGMFFGYLGQDLLAYYVGIIDCRALKLYLRVDPVIEAERQKHQS